MTKMPETAKCAGSLPAIQEAESAQIVSDSVLAVMAGHASKDAGDVLLELLVHLDSRSGTPGPGLAARQRSARSAS